MLGAKIPRKEEEKATSKKSLVRPPSRRTPCGQGPFFLSQNKSFCRQQGIPSGVDLQGALQLRNKKKLGPVDNRKRPHKQSRANIRQNTEILFEYHPNINYCDINSERGSTEDPFLSTTLTIIHCSINS